jgi:hypothetical protein
MSLHNLLESEDCHLFELVKVSRTLERPQSRCVLRRLKRLGGLPVFQEAAFVRRNDGVVPIIILPSSMSATAVVERGIWLTAIT